MVKNPSISECPATENREILHHDLATETRKQRDFREPTMSIDYLCASPVVPKEQTASKCTVDHNNLASVKKDTAYNTQKKRLARVQPSLTPQTGRVRAQHTASTGTGRKKSSGHQTDNHTTRNSDPQLQRWGPLDNASTTSGGIREPYQIPDRNAEYRRNHSAQSENLYEENAHQVVRTRTEFLINPQGEAENDTQAERKSALHPIPHPKASQSLENVASYVHRKNNVDIQANPDHFPDYPVIDHMTATFAAAQPWSDSAASVSGGSNNSLHDHTKNRSMVNPMTKHDEATSGIYCHDAEIVKTSTCEQLDDFSDKEESVGKRDGEVEVEKILPKDQRSLDNEIESDPPTLSVKFGKAFVTSSSSDEMSVSESEVLAEMANCVGITPNKTPTQDDDDDAEDERLATEQILNVFHGDIPPYILTTKLPDIDTELHSEAKKGNRSPSCVLYHDSQIICDRLIGFSGPVREDPHHVYPLYPDNTVQENSSADRPFTCNICDRSFKRLDTLRRHGNTHTAVKPYRCLECSKSFSRRESQIRHQLKTHQPGNILEEDKLRIDQCRGVLPKKRSSEQSKDHYVDDTTRNKKVKSEVSYRVPAIKCNQNQQIEPKSAKEHQTRSRTKETASARLTPE